MKTFNPKRTLVIVNGLFIAILVAAQLTMVAQVIPIVDTHHLMWSAQLGTSGTDKAEGIACEFLGNTYTCGNVGGASVMGINQPLNSYRGGSFDGFVTKTNIYGQELWTAFVGGNGNDFCTAIAATQDDHVIVIGYTSSTDLAAGTTSTSYHGGNRDAFCSKLTKEGELVWSIYIGGNGDDYTQDLAIAENGDIFIVGKTSSNTVDYTSQLQADYGGGTFDGFLAKVSQIGEIKKFAYLGGTGTDEIKDITFDRDGNICICGSTAGVEALSSITTMPYFGGVSDAFVTCLNDELQINWAEYVGGAGADLFNSIALDTAGNVVVGGNTNSGPIAFLDNSGVLSANNTDAMLMSFTPNGTLLWSQFVTGSGAESVKDIHVDLFGNIYVGGTTESANINVVEAFQEQNAGGIDMFISKFNTLGEMKWQSYMGGTGHDWFGRMASDRFGKVMVAGFTNSATFGEEVNYGTTDAFYARLSDCNNPDVVIHTIDDTTFCYGDESLFTACGANHYVWMNQDTVLLTTVDTTNSVYVKGYNLEGCWGMSNRVQVTTLEVPEVVIEPLGATTFCGEGTVELMAICETEAMLTWNDEANTEGDLILADTARTYSVSAEGLNGCMGSASITIEFIELPHASMTVAQNSVCISGTPVPLLGLPEGGFFMGEGVVGNTFDPGLAGGGIHELQYVIMDKNGCEGSSSSSTIEVMFYPTVLFVADDSICTFDDPFVLVGEPIGGTFSGDGVLGDTFYPALPGTGGQNISYTYLDNQGCLNVANQVIFVDPCEITAVENIEATTFQVYPNPAESFFMIQSPDNNLFSATLMNISGQQIESFNGFNQVRIPTEHLPAGCYFVKINGTESSSIIQMMIQH
jgi:hypothetical protein